MNLLLDTHAVLWWVREEGLSRDAAAAIADTGNRVWVSAASIWEIGIKQAKSRLQVPDNIEDVVLEDFEPLSITHDDARLAAALPPHHRDPFDRMLVAQALARELTLVSRDSRMGAYGVALLRA